MKALIKNDWVIVEPFDKWTIDNMAWLTGQEKDPDGNLLPGDSWTLVENYVPQYDGNGDIVVTEPEPEETYTVDGKTYTKSELLELLK